MPERDEEKTGLRELGSNLKGLPGNLKSGIVRHGPVDSGRARSQAIFSNLFLHIHPVRTHRWTLRKSFTFGLGIASVALFMILVTTGLFLMVYYKPSATEAYDSLKDIHYVVPGGRLMRNVHRWSAHLMVACVFGHMARVVLTASYRKPREINWLIGLGLLLLTFGLAFTGYCLPWDQLGYWATTIGANIAGSPSELLQALDLEGAPDIGDLQRRIILGSRLVGSEVIIRFNFLHCVLLPVFTSLLLGIHFWRIRKDGGMSRPDDIRPEELEGTPCEDGAEAAFPEEKTYGLMCLVEGKSEAVGKAPEHTVSSWQHLFTREMAIAMLAMLIVVAIGILVDAPLAERANPLVPENPAKAPWYFLGLQECVSYSAFTGGMLLPAVIVLVMAFYPFVDRKNNDTGRLLGGPGEKGTFWFSVILSTVVVIGMLAFTVYLSRLSQQSIALAAKTGDKGLLRGNWLRYWWPNLGQIWIILCNPGSVLFAFFSLYALVVLIAKKSVRHGVIASFTCFLVSFIIMTYFATIHRGPNWDFYWWPSQWPVH